MTKLSRKRWPLFRFLGNTFATQFVLPTRRLLFVILLGVLFAPVGFLFGMSFAFFWTYNSLLVIFSVIDLLMLPRRKQLEATRILPDRADINQPFTVSILLRNSGKQEVRVSLTDDLPLVFATDSIAALQGIAVDSNEKIVHYQTQSSARGSYVLQYLYLRYQGVLGLWTKQSRLEYAQSIRIYPDLSGVRGILGSLQQSLVIDGTRILKKAKTGTDFAYIREYTTDDDPRFINWTATARTNKLMTSVFQPEHGKIVTILLDCGRMMGVELDQRIKLDRSLEAALTLAAVALKQGDQVAVVAFSNILKVYVPVGRGLAHLQVILDAVYALQSDPEESNYSMALEYIMRNQRKRSLLVLFSDMESFLFEDQLVPYFIRMRRTHLLLLLSLQDPLLHGWTHSEVKDSRSAFIKSTAQKFTLDRKTYVQQMANRGIAVLDVAADQLALRAINYYLEIKSREAL
ncbi:MAG: hypothetical protein JWM44_2272 [Bacilli bacterium]|nr:hypothetical protein [Bacilli bacterium]